MPQTLSSLRNVRPSGVFRPVLQNEPSPDDSPAAWLYVAPALLVLAVFWMLPVFGALAISFTNWEGADTFEIVQWVGLHNYTRTLADELFWRALTNTLNYVLWAVPLTVALSLALALLVQRSLRGAGFFRTIFFLPYVSTWVAVSVLWRYFFDPEFGPINFWMEQLGLEPLRWLNEPRGVIELFITEGLGVTWPAFPPALNWLLAGPSLSLFCIIVTTIWHDLGFFVIVILAGLNNIDASYYEAARIDGAGSWRQFRGITLPLLTPTLFFVSVIALIGAFRVFVPILVMTPEGGPAKSTTSLVFFMYEKGFMQWKLGQGAAVALILFAILFTLTLAQNALLGKRVQYEQ